MRHGDARRAARDAALPHRGGGRAHRAPPSLAAHVRHPARSLVLLPAFAGRTLLQDLIFVFNMLALAQCWNLLAGYAGLVSVGQQAFVGARRLCAVRLHADRRASIRCSPSRSPGVVAGARSRCPPRSSSSACAAPISPSAPGSWPRSSGSSSRSSSSSAAAPAPRCRPTSRGAMLGLEWVRELFGVRALGGARHRRLLAGAGCSPPALSAASTGCCARATGWRSPRSATPRPRPRALGVDIFRTKLVVYVVDRRRAPAWSAR